MSAKDGGKNRRISARYDVMLSVDCTSGDTFLFSYIRNISEMGIFVTTHDPMPVGTRLTLRFAPGGGTPLELAGDVVWINPYRPGGDNLNPGMGVRFRDLTADQRERIVDIVRTIAYLHDDPPTNAD